VPPYSTATSLVPSADKPRNRLIDPFVPYLKAQFPDQTIFQMALIQSGTNKAWVIFIEDFISPQEIPADIWKASKDLKGNGV
jgi:hypothetical protein